MSQTQLPIEKRELLENAIRELGGEVVNVEWCSDDVVYIETTRESGCFALIPNPFAPGFPLSVSCEEECPSMKEEEDEEEEEELWETFEIEWEQEEEDEWDEEDGER